jgi:hypothetical protein
MPDFAGSGPVFKANNFWKNMNYDNNIDFSIIRNCIIDLSTIDNSTILFYLNFAV